MPAKNNHDDVRENQAQQPEVDEPTAGENAAEHTAEEIVEEAAEDAVDDTIDRLSEQVVEAEARAEELLDSLKRERAAFQNYKKRVERERADQQQVIAGSVLLKLLPILDDFHRAMDAVPEDERDEWFDGVALILRKFERFLDEQGVSEIDAEGAPFDPNYHEAVSVDPDADAAPETVTDVLQRGYMHGDRVLRPAMVRVAG